MDEKPKPSKPRTKKKKSTQALKVNVLRHGGKGDSKPPMEIGSTSVSYLNQGRMITFVRFENRSEKDCKLKVVNPSKDVRDAEFTIPAGGFVFVPPFPSSWNGVNHSLSCYLSHADEIYAFVGRLNL